MTIKQADTVSAITFSGTNLMAGDRAKWVYANATSCDPRFDVTTYIGTYDDRGKWYYPDVAVSAGATSH